MTEPTFSEPILSEPIPHPIASFPSDPDQVANAAADTVREKLTDALTPGYQAEFDPEEAERAGAFVEDALSEQEALDSQADLADAGAAPGREG